MTIADKLALLEQTKEAQRVKLGLPKNIPFSQYIKFIRDPFTPADLFKNGEQGVWLDPSDLSTMFQDVNGTEPVTEDGDPVGLILDKSQSLSTDIPLINTDVVDFNSNNWRFLGKVSEVEGNSFTASGGGAVLEGLIVGRVYKLVSTISHTQELDIRNGSHGGAPRVILLPVSSKRTLELFFVAASTALYFRFGVTGTLTIHNIMVAEVKGNHATQPTASARPIYRTDGILHWLKFDGIDDQLSFNRIIYISDNFMGAVATEAKSNGSAQFALGDSALPVKVGRLNDADTFIRVQDGATDINPKIWQGVDVLSFGRYDNTLYAGVGKTRKTLNSAPSRAWFSLLGATSVNTHRLDGKVFAFSLTRGYSADKEQNLLSYSSIKAGLPL